MDNSTGFSAAIEAVFPKTEIRNCGLYEPSALAALDAFSGRWDKKYSKISRYWRENWANLSTYFKFPQEIRRLIYTINTIEGFNRQFRKVAKSVFPTDDSLLKMLYLAMVDITRIGASFMHSARFTSKIACQHNTARPGGQGFPCRLRRHSNERRLHRLYVLK